MNKKRPDAATDTAERTGLLSLYVMRANELSQHILDYEAAERQEELARSWQADAETYVSDPVGESRHA